MFKKLYLIFILFVFNNAYSNDLCDLLLNDDFIVPEITINEGFTVNVEIEVKKVRIYSQSTLSEFAFDQRTRFPNEKFAKFINKNYPNLKSNSCLMYGDEKIRTVLKKIEIIEPTIRSNKMLENKFRFLSVFRVFDKELNKDLWGYEYEQSKKFEIENINTFNRFPFDSIATYVDFEYEQLKFEEVFDDYDLEYGDQFGEGKKSQLEWNKSQIKNSSTMNEFKLIDHGITKEEMTFVGGGTYPSYLYYFEFKRNVGYYILKVLLPVIFIVFLSFSVFWIRNQEIEAKLNVSIVCLLALIAYNFAVNSDIPKINNLTILDSFVLISYLFSGLSTFMAIYSYYDYRRDKLVGDFNPIDKKLRKAAPSFYILSIIVVCSFIYTLE